MEHNISLACVRYRLRPVTLEDAAFIVALRNDPLLNRYLHEISPRVEDQVGWLEHYFHARMTIISSSRMRILVNHMAR